MMIGLMLFLIVSLSMVGLYLLVLVKTDLNWFNNNSVFPLLSLMRFVPFFSGAIPPDY